MKNQLTNKPTNAVKPLLSSRGFALIATISILSLIALISLALLSLATTKTKVSSYSNHLNIARDNARLALEIAIGQLQKYTGPDQRVTARADITDKDWTNLTPQVANPYYHLAWDVSGSEIDYTANSKGYNNSWHESYKSFPSPSRKSDNRAYPNLGTVNFGSVGGVLDSARFGLPLGTSGYRRPGMDPAHDFRKKPAVLVSGNEFYDLTEAKGVYKTADYPTGYVTANTSLAGRSRVEIIPSESIMGPGSLGNEDFKPGDIKVEVPIVKLSSSVEGSSYAYWIGDESLKARVNLEKKQATSDTEQSIPQIAQSLPLLLSFYDGKEVKEGDKPVQGDSAKRLTMSSLELSSKETQKTGVNYSPDVTTSSESLVVDVRNGGFKQDFTYALHNPDLISPVELWDNSIPLDAIKKPSFAGGQITNATRYWSPSQGFLPLVEKWRNLALNPLGIEKKGGVDVAKEIECWEDDRGLYPVMSQVQMAQHVAYEVLASTQIIDPLTLSVKEEGTFNVYMGIFPSVTLWNPYNVPLKLSQDITLSLVRRELTLDGSRNKMLTNYDLQKEDGSVENVDVVWPPAQTGWLKDENNNFVLDAQENKIPVFREDELWSGWIMKSTLRLKGNPVVIQPGETMVFSAKEVTTDKIPMNTFYQKTVTVDLVPGWNPGTGVLLRMDDKTHTYEGKLPKVRLVQPNVKDNLAWVLNGQGKSGSRYLNYNQPNQLRNGWRMQHIPASIRYSLWPRLDAVAQNTSSFFVAPSINDGNQDVKGQFPGLMVKHSLRMGDDYLLTPEESIKKGQTELSFPYLAYSNPAALIQAGFADSNSSNTGEALAISPTLMGGVYDYQTAGENYPVPTKPVAKDAPASLATPIGIGYLNGEKLILMNRPLALDPLSDFVVDENGASSSIKTFSQLNASQFLKGQRQVIAAGASELFGSLSSSNVPVYPIGNSLANPKLDVEHLDRKFDRTVNFGGIGKNYGSPPGKEHRTYSMELDYSYILNDLFYDHYFFSTIPQAPGAYNENAPLVNNRLVPSDEAKADYGVDSLKVVPRREQFVPLTKKELDLYTNKLKNIDSAQHLTLVGGFNVNSTSVPAWEMLLSSSLGVKRKGVVSDETISFSNKEANSELAAGKVTEEDALDSDFYMTLTRSQVRKLAEAMVSEVKRRGPFPSLSAFVNRANYLRDMARPNPNNGIGSDDIVDARYSGAIQSALDRTTGSNKELDASRTIDKKGFLEESSPGNWIYPAKEAFRKSINSHLPGYLKQSDVLAQIAPVITVRGDTFTIRCFGASGKGPDGRPIAKAVCEAVVQRGKEFVDPANPIDTEVNVVKTQSRAVSPIPTTSNLTEMNQRFGRKYKIISFKWLSQSDVNKMTISDL